MEPIQRVEGVGPEKQTQQAMVVTQIMRERYWGQRAQETPPIESSSDSGEANNEKQPKQQVHEGQQQASGGMRRTFAEFDIDQETRKVHVRIIDADSGELLRVIPPEDLAKEIASGNLPMAKMRRLTIHL